MLARLVQFALAQRLFVLIAGLVLMAGGWLAFKDLPIDAFPDVSSTQVKIIMKAPGMTPEEGNRGSSRSADSPRDAPGRCSPA